MESCAEILRLQKGKELLADNFAFDLHKISKCLNCVEN